MSSVIIVTGSSRGIGREVARLLLHAGHRVAINGRDAQRLHQTATALAGDAAPSAARDSLLAVAADITTEEGAALLIRETLARFGRIDGLINNAGASMRGSIGDLRLTTIEQMYRGNLVAAVLPTVAALPALLESGGSVAFVSTVGALWGFPGISLYSAAKAAVESFARALDGEYRSSGLRVGVCFLGFVENDADKVVVAADGTPFRHSRKARQTQVQAARAIIRTLQSRRRRHISTCSGRVLAALVGICPALVAAIFARSGGRVHRVSPGE